MDNMLKNLKMITKITIVPAIILIFLLILCGISLSTLMEQADTIDHLSRTRFDIYRETTEIRSNVLKVHKTLYGILTWYTTGYYADAKIEEIAAEQMKILDESINLTTGLISRGDLSEEEKKIYNEITYELLDYSELALMVVATATSKVAFSTTIKASSL